MHVAVIDDDPLITIALRTILEADPDVSVCASGGSGEDAVRIFRALRPDILLMDIRMKGMDGLAAAEQILRADPSAKILLLTTFLDDEYIVRAIRGSERTSATRFRSSSIRNLRQASVIFRSATAKRRSSRSLQTDFQTMKSRKRCTCPKVRCGITSA